MEVILNLKYDFVHNKIIYNVIPSLRHLATVRIAINLWYEEEVIEKWNTTQRTIEGKVPSLTIPESLKEKIALMAELIGQQLDNLSSIVSRRLNFQSKWHLLHKEIYWTAEGTIDKKRTFEAFTDCEELDLETRFAIASDFYLEDRINALSVQLPLNYFEWNENYFYSLSEMAGLSTARKHFGLLPWTVPNYYRCCIYDDSVTEMQYYFYWQHFTEETKNEFILDLYNPCASEDVILFLVTQHNDLQKQQLLQSESTLCDLLDALLDLRWFPFFVACINEVSGILDTHTVLRLLLTCVRQLDSTFAYRIKYARVCANLIRLLNNKEAINDYCLSDYDMRRIVCILLKVEEIKCLESFLEWLSVEERKQLTSKLKPQDLVLLFTKSLQFGALNSTISILLPSIEDRKNFLINDGFVNIVSSLVEKKKLCELDEIFSSLSSSFSDVESYKRQFADARGFELCQKFYDDGKWECCNDFIKWNFTTQNEIDSFYSNTLFTAVFALRTEQSKKRSLK